MAPILLSDYGLVCVSGEDSETFLQGLVTSNIQEITESLYRFTLFCNIKGRAVAACKLFKRQNTFYLSLPKAILPTLLEHLKKYSIFSKVEVSDVSDEFVQTGIIGLENSLDLSFPSNPLECVTIDKTTILRLPDEKPRFLMIAEHSPEQASKDEKATQLWKKADILAKLPDIYPETSECFTPQMLNYGNIPGGISFEKGCYLGQEIIARTQYLGKAKKHLQVMCIESIEAIAKPGVTITNSDGKPVGSVLQASTNSCSIYLLLAVEKTAIQSKLYLDETKAFILQNNSTSE